MKLHMGVVDIPYADETGMTTFGVAKILEDEYHIFETFARMQEPAIAHVLENSLAGHLEDSLMGKPPGGDPFAAVGEELGQMFRTFLDEDEVRAAGVPGTPTAASLKGVNHRKKGKKNKGGSPRPSFIDTGLYRSTGKFWID